MLPNIPDDTAIRVALVNSVEAVRRSLAGMLEPFAPRIRLTTLEPEGTLFAADTRADVALFDVHVGDDPLQRVRALVEDPRVAYVALFANSSSPFLIDAALAIGAAGVVTKGSEPATLATALEQISLGRQVGLERRPADDTPLTEREQEVLRLLGMGLSNQAIGRELFLGVETIRTHVRQILRKLGVVNRTQAALRATALTFDEALHRDEAPHRTGEETG